MDWFVHRVKLMLQSYVQMSICELLVSLRELFANLHELLTNLSKLFCEVPYLKLPKGT